MKSIADINQQMNKVQSAIMALNAMNTTVQSVMIAGSKPVIRIARNGHCARLLEQGEKVSYAVAVLSEKYSVSERKVYALVKRFQSDCKTLAV